MANRISFFRAPAVLIVCCLFALGAVFKFGPPLLEKFLEKEGEEEAGPQFPAEAMAFRNLQLQDENGFIPPDGLLRAKGHMDALKSAFPQPQSPANITSSSWVWLGPGNIGGRVRSIVIDPSNTSTWFAGSVSGGIWKTTNSGGTWAPVNDFMANLSVSTLVMQPGTPATIYAGTGEGFYNADGIRGAGIFKTVNGGTNWTQLSSTTSFLYVNRLAMSPNASVLLAATRSGLFRSTDGGTTFPAVISSGFGAGITDADFNPADSTKAVASGYDGNAWYSIDGGSIWTPATGLPAGSFRRVEVAYAPSNPSVVYASIDLTGGSLYKSTDGGVSYSLVFNTTPDYLASQGWYDNALWVDPTNANTLIVGGVDLWKSLDGGASFAQISAWQYAQASAHADHHTIVTFPGFDGTTNKMVVFGNDGGVYSTADVYTVGSNTPQRSAGWVEKNNNLGITQFYGAAGNAASGVVFGGTQDNGTLRYSPAGGTEGWTSPFGGDGGFSAADPTDPNYFYGEYVYLQIHRNSTGGVSPSSYIFNGISEAGTNAANFIAPFILDPNNANTMLAGGGQLWRSANVKAAVPTWVSIKPSISSPISAIAVAQGNSSICWVGHNNGNVYKTTTCTNSTPTWTQVDTNTVALPNRFVQRVTIDPIDTNRVYVAFGGYSTPNLWRTPDGGASWGAVSGSGGTALPTAPVRDLDIHPSNPNWLYAATEVGILTSIDMGATWQVPQNGPANVSVDETFFLGTTLFAATHGRGIYKADASSNDDFLNRILLTGTVVTTTGSNSGFTAEMGEPSDLIGAGSGTASAWWTWTAPCSFAVSSPTALIDTIGSVPDTVLGVFTGSSVNALTRILSDDNSGGNNSSRVPSASPGPSMLNVVSGTVFHIRVRSASTGTGNITLNINTPCVLPPTITGIVPNSGNQNSVIGATVSGTDLTGASAVAFSGTGVTATIGSGGSATSLPVTITITAGATLGMRTATVTTPGGTSAPFSGFTVNLASNDNFADRRVLTGNVVTGATGSNALFTSEAGEPTDLINTGSGTPSAWWTWTAPCGFTVSSPTSFIDTKGSTFDTVLGIFTGSTLNALTRIASDDDSGGSLTSQVPSASPGPASLIIVGGTAYQIRVRGFDSVDTGNITLNISSPCASAPVITGITPNSGAQGAAVSATIQGTGLSGSSAVTFSGSGVTATIGTGGTATSLPVTITVLANAATSLRTATVTASSLTSLPFSGFTITTPARRRGGQTISVEGPKPPNPPNPNAFTSPRRGAAPPPRGGKSPGP